MRRLAGIVVLVCALAGCVQVYPTVDVDAVRAEAVEAVFATMTASVPTPTPVPTATATPAAPPVMHSIIGRDDCLLCHAADSPIRPAPTSHAEYANEQCLACHGRGE